ncbi:MAG: cell division protein ZapA [Gammaproteobacteria bacterium]|nr:cell division protein ZapA [Gammaproteobacteria bacterium]
MSETTTAIKLKFLGKELQVACKPSEKDALLRAAEHVNNEMLAIKAKGGNPSVEKLAIIIAMNMANELLQLRESSTTLANTSARLGEMESRIAEAIK